MKDYLRSYCFSSLDLHQNHNLKNIALIWVTLEKNSKFDTQFYKFLGILWRDSHFLKRLYTYYCAEY